MIACHIVNSTQKSFHQKIECGCKLYCKDLLISSNSPFLLWLPWFCKLTIIIGIIKNCANNAMGGAESAHFLISNISSKMMI